MSNQSWRQCVKKSWLNREVKGIWFYVIFIALIISVAFIFPVKQQNVQVEQKEVVVEKIEAPKSIIGLATYYDYDLDRKDQRCLTNNCYSMFHATCASREFKRGTILKVTNLDNLKSVECRVNDFGPMSCKDRIKNGLDTPDKCVEREIDLSSYAFKKIANTKLGLINVEINVIK